MSEIKTPREVLEFWFSDRVRPLWFNSNPEFDRELTERFRATYQAAATGALREWENSAEGALALVIALDQFPLNMFRGQPRSFATEGAARDAVRCAIDRGFDRQLTDEQKGFLYLPFMHSEDPRDQDRSVELYQKAGLADSLKWAEHHRGLIRRFGRFPHRNAILGRDSTPEECVYLASDEAFLG